MNELFHGVVARLQQIFDPATLGAQAAQFLANLFVALLVLLAFYLLWRLVDLPLRLLMRRSRFDDTTGIFIRTLSKYGILTIGVFSALETAGVKTAPILASVGIAGLTIGFAARDALSNIISGVLIFLDRPFTINDLVEIQGSYGRVEQITLRSTRIVTVDGRMLAVPNSQVVNNTVASYTNFPHLRLDVGVNVGVEESIDRVRHLLTGIVHGDPAFLTDPPPRVVVTQLNDYNLRLELRVWLQDERAHLDRRLELLERIHGVLSDARVSMPLETIQLAPFDARIHRPGDPGDPDPKARAG